MIEVNLIEMSQLHHTFKVLVGGHQVGYTRRNVEDNLWYCYFNDPDADATPSDFEAEHRKEAAALRLALAWFRSQPS